MTKITSHWSVSDVLETLYLIKVYLTHITVFVIYICNCCSSIDSLCCEAVKNLIVIFIIKYHFDISFQLYHMVIGTIQITFDAHNQKSFVHTAATIQSAILNSVECPIMFFPAFVPPIVNSRTAYHVLKSHNHLG